MAAEEAAAADFAATAARTGLPHDGWTTVGAWSDEVAHVVKGTLDVLAATRLPLIRFSPCAARART